MTTERDRRNQTQYEVDQAEKRGLEKGREEGEAIGLEKGLAEGEKIGEARGIEQTARTMLSMGYPIEDISKITGLPVEALKSLK